MSGQKNVILSAEGLAKMARAAEHGKGLPPVNLWNPPFSGNIDICIERDGTWLHEGSPINRPALVRLFSTILRKEGESYYLVTPVEKVGIAVEDVPFVAVDFDVRIEDGAQALVFAINVGDKVVADAEHPLRIAYDATGEPAPYVMVRDGLEARIDRKSFYRLVELGEHERVDGESWFGLTSRSTFFKVMRSAELPPD